MILLNFSHPITAKQLEQIEYLTAQKIERLIEINCQIDHGQPLTSQVRALAEQVTLSSFEWQSRPLLVNLPALNFGAAVLMAELHGRCGYFSPVIRLRPVAGCLPPQYEVAEILNLQEIRENARCRR